MQCLANKNIIIGVAGGIAGYKVCELIRLLKKEQCEVRVIMTKNAENFIGPLSFATLSGNPVLLELGADSYDTSSTSHIDLAQWGDIFIGAPATANLIAKLATGICDDALTTEALAFQGPILLAPAMNSRMWEAEITQKNWNTLKNRGIHFIGPEKGDLACGETGIGKMSEATSILSAIEEIFKESSHKILKGKKVLVTSGPTRSHIDSMRFISNRSSGRMGHSIAVEAEKLGAEVALVTGPTTNPSFNLLSKGRVYPIETNEEMLSQCLSLLPEVDMVFSVAAICDFEVKSPYAGKLDRKEELGLTLKASQDIISTLVKRKKANQVFVAFAAEAGSGKKEIARAVKKLEQKGVDIIAMNDIKRKDIAIDSDENELYIFRKNTGSTPTILSKNSKSKIAKQLIQLSLE